MSATTNANALFRKLPSVDEVLRLPGMAEIAASETVSAGAITDAARAVLDRLREEIAAGQLKAEDVEIAVNGIAEAVSRELRQSFTPSLKPVINATGVILHTNLGRAPLSEAAMQHIAEVARGYSNLEFDIATGERGKRDVHVQKLFA